LTEEKNFEFALGQRVRVKDALVVLQVVGHIRFVDGAIGYVCSGWSHAHNAMLRHTIAPEEIEAVPGEKANG
jgi:hypothetical protein